MPKVYFATDHAGFPLKQELVSFVTMLGYEGEDLGARTLDPLDDYPDLIAPAAARAATDEGSLAIILGGSGQGEAMVANRTPGARAAVYYGGSLELVRLAREHNNANLLSLGARFLDLETAKQAVALFLETPFSGEERHVRRIAKF